MQSTAQSYLVYELTGSSAYLGYVGLAAGLPSLMLLNLVGGVVSDRIARRKLLILTQSAMMVLAFILAGLVISGLVAPWHIIVLAFTLGVVNAFDAPARLAFVAELVSREDMTNAIALNATMFNIGTVIGPAVAGATYAAFGAGWCFLINGISFIAVILALAMMRIVQPAQEARQRSIRQEIVEGFRYTVTEPVTRVIIANLAVIATFGISLMTLMPAWAVEIMHGDVRTNAQLLSARGAGALVAAIMLAATANFGKRGRIWSVGNLLMPFALLIFAFIKWLPLSLAVLALIGWAYITQVNSSNALVQDRVPNHLRGRVMGIYSLIFFASMPIGSFLIGQSAETFGLSTTVLVGGLICLSVASFIWLRFPGIRRLK